MSEEFDKEAEREKLREKYEKDEQQRKETQRMSELLLQGATMTNEHCGNCGDPLFRDDGQTFCPTCGGGNAGATGEPAATAEQSEQATNGQEAAEQPRQRSQQPTRTDEGQSAGRERTAAAEQSESVDVSGQERRPRADDGQPTQQRTPEPSAGADPRAELQRAVTRAARKANEATDPRTAKQWLEASKEAAEALATLEK